MMSAASALAQRTARLYGSNASWVSPQSSARPRAREKALQLFFSWIEIRTRMHETSTFSPAPQRSGDVSQGIRPSSEEY